MGNEVIQALIAAVTGGGVSLAIKSLLTVRSERDSIVVDSAGKALDIQQRVLDKIYKEIEDNRAECEQEIKAIRERCELERKASQEECRLAIEGRDAALAALRRDFEEFRQNAAKN